MLDPRELQLTSQDGTPVRSGGTIKSPFNQVPKMHFRHILDEEEGQLGKTCESRGYHRKFPGLKGMQKLLLNPTSPTPCYNTHVLEEGV